MAGAGREAVGRGFLTRCIGLSCPNCGAPLLTERRCPQCGAVVPPRSVSTAQAEALAEKVDASTVERVFAMPLASTRPQSAGHGASWWVCVAVKPTRARVVLARKMTEAEAVALAGALAARLNLD